MNTFIQQQIRRYSFSVAVMAVALFGFLATVTTADAGRISLYASAGGGSEAGASILQSVSIESDKDRYLPGEIMVIRSWSPARYAEGGNLHAQTRITFQGRTAYTNRDPGVLPSLINVYYRDITFRVPQEPGRYEVTGFLFVSAGGLYYGYSEDSFFITVIQPRPTCTITMTAPYSRGNNLYTRVSWNARYADNARLLQNGRQISRTTSGSNLEVQINGPTTFRLIGNNNKGACYENKQVRLPRCSNTRDDEGDGFTDADDPGCWRDPLRPNTYDPADNSEQDSLDCSLGAQGDLRGRVAGSKARFYDSVTAERGDRVQLVTTSNSCTRFSNIIGPNIDGFISVGPVSPFVTGPLTLPDAPGTYTYTYRVTDVHGNRFNDSLTVTVIEPQPVVDISVVPDTALDVGDGYSVVWTSANVESVQITENNTQISTAANSNANRTANAVGTIEYRIVGQRIGGGAPVEDTVRVTITAPEPAVSISSNKTAVSVGETYTVTWNAQNVAGAVVTEDGTQIATSNRGSTTRTAANTGSVLYRIVGQRVGGGAPVEDTVTVAAVTECADDADNDGDGQSDRQDPGCWADPRDPTTYNRNDNDESGEGPTDPATLGVAPDISITANGVDDRTTVRAATDFTVEWDPNGYTTPPAPGVASGVICTLSPAALFTGQNARVAGSITIQRDALTEFSYRCTSPDGVGQKAWQGGEDKEDTVSVEVTPQVFES